MQFPDEQLRALVHHFSILRESILNDWQRRVQQDPDLNSPTSLPRTQFRDHIPQVLIGFEKSLQAGARESLAEAERQGETGAEHGVHRWQQGYDLHEVMREWGHLQQSLVDCLEDFALSHPHVNRVVIGQAHRTLVALFSQGIEESTQQFVRMQKAEAAAQLRDLTRAVRDSQKLQQNQSDLLREATHDLRGQLGIVKSAADVLGFDGLPDDSRSELRNMLQRSLLRQNELFNELMDLARLQAGQEQRKIESIDIAPLLRQLGESVTPMAHQRDLTVAQRGPESLAVECDPIRVCRIAQNLLLNAIRYTSHGGVVLSWGGSRANDPDRWMMCIQDTGPGFPAVAGSLPAALQEATEESKLIEQGKSASTDEQDHHSPSHLCSPQIAGEGIGLSIVKRLCELLDASMELESGESKGTVFRVLFPKRYPR